MRIRRYTGTVEAANGEKVELSIYLRGSQRADVRQKMMVSYSSAVSKMIRCPGCGLWTLPPWPDGAAIECGRCKANRRSRRGPHRLRKQIFADFDHKARAARDPVSRIIPGSAGSLIARPPAPDRRQRALERLAAFLDPRRWMRPVRTG